MAEMNRIQILFLAPALRLRDLTTLYIVGVVASDLGGLVVISHCAEHDNKVYTFALSMC